MWPFFLLGAGHCAWRWRESRGRTLWIALLAAPASAALAGISAYRALAIVVPANAFIAIGICWALDFVREPRLVRAARGLVFAGLALSGFTLLMDCLTDGPVYSREYGLYGMQWGAAPRLRDTYPRLLRAHPRARVFTTTDWANGVNVFGPFFHLPEERVAFVNLDVIRAGA